MPILKVEILGSKIEINYEEKEYDKLINLINNFKNRLNEFPNDGRVSSNSKFFLTALKLEDELKEHKDLLINNELSNNKIKEQKKIIKNLENEIILLNNKIDKFLITYDEENKNDTIILTEVDKLKNKIEAIQKKFLNALDRDLKKYE